MTDTVKNVKYKIKKAEIFPLNWTDFEFISFDASRGQCSVDAMLFHVLAGVSMCMRQAEVDVDGRWKERPVIWSVIGCRQGDRSLTFPGSYTKRILNAMEVKFTTKAQKRLQDPGHLQSTSSSKNEGKEQVVQNPKTLRDEAQTCRSHTTKSSTVLHCMENNEAVNDGSDVTSRFGLMERELQTGSDPDPKAMQNDEGYSGHTVSRSLSSEEQHESVTNDTNNDVDGSTVLVENNPSRPDESGEHNIEGNANIENKDMDNNDISLTIGSTSCEVKLSSRSLSGVETTPDQIPNLTRIKDHSQPSISKDESPRDNNSMSRLFVDELSLPALVRCIRSRLETVGGNNCSDHSRVELPDEKVNLVVILSHLVLPMKMFSGEEILCGHVGELPSEFYISAIYHGLEGLSPRHPGFTLLPRLNAVLTLPTTVLASWDGSRSTSLLLDCALLNVTKDPPIKLQTWASITDPLSAEKHQTMERVMTKVYQTHSCTQKVVYRFGRAGYLALKRHLMSLDTLKAFCEESDDDRGYAFTIQAQTQLVRLAAVLQAIRNASQHGPEAEKDSTIKTDRNNVCITSMAVIQAVNIVLHSLLHKSALFAKLTTVSQVQELMTEFKQNNHSTGAEQIVKNSEKTRQTLLKHKVPEYARDSSKTAEYSTIRKQLNDITYESDSIAPRKTSQLQVNVDNPVQEKRRRLHEQGNQSDLTNVARAQEPVDLPFAYSPPSFVHPAAEVPVHGWNGSIRNMKAPKNRTTELDKPVSMGISQSNETTENLDGIFKFGSGNRTNGNVRKIKPSRLSNADILHDSPQIRGLIEIHSNEDSSSTPMFIKEELLELEEEPKHFLATPMSWNFPLDNSLSTSDTSSALPIPNNFNMMYQDIPRPEHPDMRFQSDEEFFHVSAHKIRRLLLTPCIYFQVSAICQKRLFPPVPVQCRAPAQLRTSHPVWAATYFVCRLSFLGLGYIAHPSGRAQSVVFVKHPLHKMTPQTRALLASADVDEAEYASVYESCDLCVLSTLDAVEKEETEHIASQAQPNSPMEIYEAHRN